MKLNRVQRWILSNQHKILASLTKDQNEAAHYDRIRAILECGYELEYEWHIQHIYPEDQCLTADQCIEVLDILSMFTALQHSYEELQDKSGIDAHWITFRGFDGNSESAQLGYCRHVRSEGKFENLEPGKDNFNSHAPLLDTYRRMLSVWKPLRTEDMSGKAEIVSSINAMPHPESPKGKLRDMPGAGTVQ